MITEKVSCKSQSPNYTPHYRCSAVVIDDFWLLSEFKPNINKLVITDLPFILVKY